MNSPRLPRLAVLATLLSGPAWTQQYALSTYAGGAWPTFPAAGTSISVGFPQAVVPDGRGNVYFGSWGLNGVFKLDAAGMVTVVAGSGTPASWPTAASGYGDGGPATAAFVGSPGGLALDAQGNLFIADTTNNRVRRVDANGIITTVAGGGFLVPGDGEQATLVSLWGPSDVAVDAEGSLYIADTFHSSVRKVAWNGIVTTLAGGGFLVGSAANGRPATQLFLSRPMGLAVDLGGNLYVTDAGRYYAYKISPTGAATVAAGNGSLTPTGDGRPATSAGICPLFGLAADAAGNLYFPDELTSSIRKVDTSGILTTVAGAGAYGFAGDGGSATAARLSSPGDAAPDSGGVLWIADTSNFRLRKVDAAGVIATVAGVPGWSYSGDGGPATSAQLSAVSGVATDAAGNLFIADTSNARVRKVSTAGIIATVAGNGIMGSSGDGGPATSAQFFSPASVAVDAAGNLYVADLGAVRKVDPSGNIGTSLLAAGSDNLISSVSVDAAGNLYVAYGQRIRKLAPGGAVTLVAGNGTAGFSGDGAAAAQAQLFNPACTAADAAGNLFIADLGNARIRKVDPAGIVTTVAGNGTFGYSGDGGPATSAQLWNPAAVALDSAGNLVIADGRYVRRIDKAGIITSIAAGLNGAVGIAAGAGGQLFVAEANNDVVRLLVPPVPDLTVSVTHSGSFTQGRMGAVYTIVVRNAGGAATSGAVSMTNALPGKLTAAAMSGTGWSCSLAMLTCTRSGALASGATYPAVTLTVNIASDAPPSVIDTATVSGGGETYTANDSAADVTAIGPNPDCTYALGSAALTFPATGGKGAVAVVAGAGCYWAASVTLGWVTLTAPAAGSGSGTAGLTVAPNAGSPRAGTIAIAGLSFTVQQVGASAGARFVPVTPCRVADTRAAAGPFGGPAMAAGSARSFAVPASACAIPSTALAYSLNVTVLPNGPLSYLTLWPTGQNQPLVSTLNSWQGAVLANAAIVPAGVGGAISVYVTDSTDMVLDIDGYFDPGAGPGSYSFYPASPCRIADTRGPAGPFGAPSLSPGLTRGFPLASSSCVPAAAGAYSLNVTAVPDTHYLAYLTIWPAGQPQPVASTLNSWTGKVVANAAIVPAGTSQAISLYAPNSTEVILDLNGYFAAPGSAGALLFYPVTPCRVTDTRGADGPILEAGATRSFPIPASGCFVPSTAAAYSLNVTVAPQGPLYYLTLWPQGSAQPSVSTLNSWDGSVVANAAIVPAGKAGAISVFAAGRTDLVLDINGYFAP